MTDAELDEIEEAERHASNDPVQFVRLADARRLVAEVRRLRGVLEAYSQAAGRLRQLIAAERLAEACIRDDHVSPERSWCPECQELAAALTAYREASK